MHSVGSEFVLGMRPRAAPTPRPYGLLTTTRDDFRSQTTFCERFHQCRRIQISHRNLTASCSSGCFCRLPFDRTSLASTHRSAFVRILMRDARRDVDDLAVAPRMVRQPSALVVSHAPRRGSQRLHPRYFDRPGRAQRVDRILGSCSISRGMNELRH